MPSEIELAYLRQGYRLPQDLDWGEVAEARARWGIDPGHVPISCARGACVGWGVPFVRGRPLRPD